VRLNAAASPSPEMQDIYNWLKVEFQPLKLKDIDENEELASLEEYDKALRDITLIKLL